jgi:diaminopimelate decarboxylase
MNAPKAKHVEMSDFPIVDGELTVGGVKVSRLANQVGMTPFYAYDRRLMTQRIAHLRTHLPPAVHIHYAMKANPMPAVVQHIGPLVDGLDVASAREMQVALNAGVAPSLISMAGPGKSREELARAVAAGITINLESEHELRVVIEHARQQQLTPRVAVRVNPDFELKASGMKMGGGPKQFGVDADRVPAMLQSMRGQPVEFVGFHIFSGSQNLKAEAIIEAQTKAVALAIRLAADAPAPLKMLNIGGGFGIPYFPGEERLDITSIGANLTHLVDEVAAHLPQAALVLELGRYIVGESGVYICRVVDRKISRGHVYLITDGGLHHHLSASGNFGQVIRKNYPLMIATRANQAPAENASVVGPLCTPLDLLGDKMDVPVADIGDLVAVFQSGAYGLTASPTAFLSHPLPGEILV